MHTAAQHWLAYIHPFGDQMVTCCRAVAAVVLLQQCSAGKQEVTCSSKLAAGLGPHQDCAGVNCVVGLPQQQQLLALAGGLLLCRCFLVLPAYNPGVDSEVWLLRDACRSCCSCFCVFCRFFDVLGSGCSTLLACWWGLLPGLSSEEG